MALVAIVLILIWRAPSDSDPGRLGQHGITMMRDGDQRVIGIELSEGDLYEGLADDIAGQSALTSIHGKDLDCPNELITALTSLPKLKSVRLERCNITTTQLQMLSQLPLRLLSLSGSKGPESGRSAIEIHSELTDLDLSGCDWIREEDLEGLAKLPKLQSLSLARTRISNTALQTLAGSSSLNRIDLSYGLQLNDEILTTLQNFQGLRQVMLAGVPLNLHATAEFQRVNPDTHLACDLMLAPDLVELLSRFSRKSNQIDAGIESGGIQITGLRTSLVLYLSEPADLSLLRYLPDLNTLQLTGPGVNNSALEVVFSLEQLQSLHLSQPDGSVSAISGLGKLKRLKNLTLDNIRCDSEMMTSLAMLKELSVLSLENTTIAIDQTRNLVTLPNLTYMGFDNVSNVHRFLELTRAPRLSHISLVSCDICDDNLTALCKFPALAALDLSENPIQGETLGQLADLPIATLDLESTALSDSGLAELARWKHLESLYLTGTPLNGSGFKDCPDLCVRSLNLSRVSLNEEGVSSICKLKGTEWLGLEGSILPPQAIQRLTNDLPLQQLVLDGVHLTPEQVPKPVTSGTLVSLTIRAANAEQLMFLRSFEHVNEVALIDCQLGADAAKTLCQTPGLKLLSISDCEISNEVLKTLTTSDTLGNIFLQGRGIDDLDRGIVDQVRPTLNITFW
jgi:Leucine-rich repeat (LRR) protein